jgi:hypothetical protein
MDRSLNFQLQLANGTASPEWHRQPKRYNCPRCDDPGSLDTSHNLVTRRPLKVKFFPANSQIRKLAGQVRILPGGSFPVMLSGLRLPKSRSGES